MAHSLLLVFLLALHTSALVDTNQNGLSDLWEMTYHDGQLLPSSFDSLADDDGDGWSNAQEAAAGTDPFKGVPPTGFINVAITHTPAVYYTPPEGGDPEIVTPEAFVTGWPSTPGKQYTLFCSPDLSAGSWLQVGVPIIESVAGHFVEVGVTPTQVGGGNPDKLFWRVSIDDVDSDGDGLTDAEEYELGFDSKIADYDGDGLNDLQEYLLGTDPRLSDTDGDGIPDNLDADPLVDFPKFDDVDDDGISDGSDSAPNTPRGLPPTITSQTASGSAVVNIMKGEPLVFLLTVKNPAGPPVSASNLKLFIGGVPNAAVFSPVGANQFVVTWDAQTHANYPDSILQSITVRFQDSENATSWLDLGRCDVAEWEGYVAAVPVYPYSSGISIRSHRNGTNAVPTRQFLVSDVGVSTWYRGSKSISLFNNASSALFGHANITKDNTDMRYPLFFVSADDVANPEGFDISDPNTYPSTGLWYLNHYSAGLTMNYAGVSTAVDSGGRAFDTTPEDLLGNTTTGFMEVRSPSHPDVPLYSGNWTNTPPKYDTRAMRICNLSAFNRPDPDPDGLLIEPTTLWAHVAVKIVPHAAGTLEYPGLPLDSGSTRWHGYPLPRPMLLIQSDVWHKVVLKVGPDAGAISKGIRLRIGSGVGGAEAPQSGFSLKAKTDSGLSDLALPADGKITMDPTSDHYQKLISPGGLTLFVERAATVDAYHRLSLDLVPRDPPKPSNNFATLAELDILPVEIVPDYNRDGLINGEDRGKVTNEKPWRFWINDDDDSGETGGTDISVEYDGSAEPDFWGNSVDGIRDLIDFFPLHLDLKSALVVMPETEFQYFLKHKSQTSTLGSAVSAPSFSVLWYPEAVLDGDPTGATGAGSYFKNLDKAADIARRPTQSIPKSGLRIPDEILLGAKDGKGVVLFEARCATDNPIQIEIRKNDGTVIGNVDFPVKISPVKDMLRYKFVMPGAADLGSPDIPGDPLNWPDADRNSKHFVFVHGYNVNDSQSKGWASEIFKRMFWSGSNARFSAFAWYGYESQVGSLTVNYQVNLDHAFGTANSFKQFLDLLEGEKTVAAHSMGNILVGSAMHDWDARPVNYLMLDSAAAKECYDTREADDAAQDARMVHPAWKDYPKQVRASEWHRLIPPIAWPSSDWRGKITWKGRFENVIENGGQTQVYNFYSSGEEVLNNPETNNPLLDSSNPFGSGGMVWVTANKIWAMQEKRKGLGLTGFIHTSNYGGWLPNLLPYDQELHMTYQNELGTVHRMRSPSELPNPLTTEFLLQLSTKPFFDDSSHGSLFTSETGSSSEGSSYAYSHRNTIISEMVPCTTFAAGMNPLLLLELDGLITNINMNDTMKTNTIQWPLSNANENSQAPNDPRSRPWLHSDIREKAFAHNWSVYERFVTIGNLK